MQVAVAIVPRQPGLYAIHADADVWEQLGLALPPNPRPLYAGKAERSLAGRDINTHFVSGRTGSSTLRRVLAGLLAQPLAFVGSRETLRSLRTSRTSGSRPKGMSG
jgi:hypothetical protein